MSASVVAGKDSGQADTSDRRGGWRRTEDQVRAALHPLLDPHILVHAVRDEDGQVVDFICDEANEAACCHLGAARDQLVGARLVALLPGDAPEHVTRSLAATLETGRPLLLEDHVDPSDLLEPERRYDVRVVRLGKTLSCTWCDVTKRHEIEQSLRRRVRELDSMHRISQILAMRTDMGAAVDAARREIGELFDARSATVCLLPETDDAASAGCLRVRGPR